MLQRDMVRRCAIAGKPVFVASHLLESMIEDPQPTRAEVTDVAGSPSARCREGAILKA